MQTSPTNQATAELPLKIGLATLGCKVNQYESAAIAEDLRKNNCLLVPFNAQADVYIINTCTVTALSDFQSRQLIHRAHRNNPQAKILVTGCYAQISPGDIAKLAGVSLVVGNGMKNKIAALLRSKQDVRSANYTVDPAEQKSFCYMPVTRFGRRTRPFLKIQDGCNSSCSYCIVPAVRGSSRSLPPPELLQALTNLIREGYKEIVFTGIHLGCYGHDLEPACDLTRLLGQLAGRCGEARIRLSSLEPREITAALLHTLHNSDFLCPHLHIPLQSGDDDILRLMRRNYDTRFYRLLIEQIYSAVSDVAIGTDVMVGFPSETDAQFENTLQLLEDLPVTYLHVFPYSERPGTAAQKIQPKIPEVVKKERAAALRHLSIRKQENFALRFLGKPLKVLVEDVKDKKTGMWKGFSQNYLPFLLDETFTSSVNKIVTLRPEKYHAGKLYGKISS
ncbi:MAG TPA: tRNA (N(6)-L-threonylcarbamoyladenosine(37)-C(2))-methylthiotransferase MtaB [Smithellaceae bacterium]|nr:tRNA (N(6)-L-threonylcarbamoyladenosine(37)-C(2))-methylthiotransferase MtaB [Smithellaceae bacterium]